VPGAEQFFAFSRLLFGLLFGCRGKSFDYPSYGWDNEYGARPVDVKPFRATEFKVTNGEFLRFVKAGCYMNPK
jgi:formylglycine-generating enzyme required for sulfatase activity